MLVAAVFTGLSKHWGYWTSSLCKDQKKAEYIPRESFHVVSNLNYIFSLRNLHIKLDKMKSIIANWGFCQIKSKYLNSLVLSREGDSEVSQAGGVEEGGEALGGAAQAALPRWCCCCCCLTPVAPPCRRSCGVSNTFLTRVLSYTHLALASHQDWNKWLSLTDIRVCSIVPHQFYNHWDKC